MNFREEYKNSIEIMSPSAEQMARMKKNIMEQVKAPEKKAIPFKKIAYIGSAVAACAVISVAAINIIPRLSGGSSLTTAESMACAGDDMNYCADGAAVEAANEDFAADDAEMGAEVKAENAHPLTTMPVMDEAEAMEEPDYDALDDVYNETCEDTITDFENGGAASIIDGITDGVFAPSATTTGIPDYDEPQINEDIPVSDEAYAPVSGEAENETSFILSADYDVLILNDVEYVLYDDGYSPPADALLIEERSAIGDVEYWFHHYGDDYLVLMCNNGNEGYFEVIGGYKKAE